MGWIVRHRRLGAAAAVVVAVVVGVATLAGAQAASTYEGTLTETREEVTLPEGFDPGPEPPDAEQPELEGPTSSQVIATCDDAGCTIQSAPFNVGTLPLQIAFGESIELGEESDGFGTECSGAPPVPTVTLTGDAEEITLARGREAFFVEGTTADGDCAAWGDGFATTFVGQRVEAAVTGPAPGATTGTPGVNSGSAELSPEVEALTGRQRSSIVAVADGDRSVVPASVATPAEAARGMERTVVNVMLAGLAVLLLVFPSQLFNATWSQHHERIERWMARRLGRRGPSSDAAPRNRLGLYALTVLAGAVLAGFLDPNLAFDAPSLTLIGGAVLSIAVGSLVLGGAAVVYRSRRGLSTSRVIDAIPSGLVVAAICVVISRAVGFRPGYLFGLVGGLVFVHALDRAEEGRAELTATIVGLAVALAAWLATIPIGAAANDGDPNLALQLADAVTAALFVGGIEGLMIGLIPIKALPGSNLFAWRRAVWVAAEFAVVFTFLQVLLRPESGYLGTSATTSTVVTAALFVGFGLASVAFWGYFRLRPDPTTPTTPHR